MQVHIPDSLVRAITQVESGGNVYAIRYEPTYRWLWDLNLSAPYKGDPSLIPAPRGASRQTELMGQRTSWGPMQVMGAVAREMGFLGWFPELCDEVIGTSFGVRLLERLAKRYLYLHGWEGVVAAYNAGSPRTLQNGRWENQRYVDKVKRAGGLR